MHKEDKRETYQSQETQYGHHVEAPDFLHEPVHMQANFQICNIL